jgi:DNA-binding LytR/AlgR family response regulator
MKKIAIAGVEETELVYAHDISYLEGDGAVSHLCVVEDTTERMICSSKNLKHYERVLPHDDFIRISKQHVVNFKFVKCIKDDALILSRPKGKELSISKDYKDNVDNRIIK